MSKIDPTTLIFWQEAGLAVLCGAIIGVERELRGKPVGIRTSILICFGTSLFIKLGNTMVGGDPTRVLGQIVTGVGFLGAGCIMARGQNVVGITTASVVWLLAAIGSMIGAHHFLAGLTVAVITVCVLVIVEWVERVISRFRRDACVPPPRDKPPEAR